MLTPRKSIAVAVVACATLAATPAYADEWSPPQVISGPEDFAGGDQSVAIDGHGTAIVTWTLQDVVQVSSRPRGGEWSAQVPLSGPHSSEPQVITDAAGNDVVAWRTKVTGGYQVFVAERRTAGDWSTPRAVSGVAGLSRVRLAGNTRGDAIVLWQSASGLASVRRGAGGRWGTPQTVSSAGRGADVAMDRFGVAHATWTRQHSRNVRVQAARASTNGRWGAATWLSQSGRDAYTPSISVDAQGSAAAVWALQSSKFVVQASHRPARGSWVKPTRLSVLTQSSKAPHIALDSRGTAIAVWQARGPQAQPPESAVITARRPAGGSWSGPATLSTWASEPWVGFDTAGNAVAGWRLESLFNPYGFQVRSRPAKGSWGPKETTRSYHTYSVDFAINGAGDVAAAWHVAGPGEEWEYSEIMASVRE